MLEKAVRYFSGDKVVTKTFDTAAKLQMKGVKEIITEDGTVFKPGTISGGNQANIFNLNLGTVQLDANISKMVEKIQGLERELTKLRQIYEGETQAKES